MGSFNSRSTNSTRVERKSLGPTAEDLEVLQTDFPKVEFSLSHDPTSSCGVRQTFNKDTLLPEFRMVLSANAVFGDVNDITEAAHSEADSRWEALKSDLLSWQDPYSII